MTKEEENQQNVVETSHKRPAPAPELINGSSEYMEPPKKKSFTGSVEEKHEEAEEGEIVDTVDEEAKTTNESIPNVSYMPAPSGTVQLAPQFPQGNPSAPANGIPVGQFVPQQQPIVQIPSIEYNSYIPNGQPANQVNVPYQGQPITLAQPQQINQPQKIIKLDPKKTSKTNLLVAVPDNKVGLIIGKQGHTVKGIQLKHRCTVQIPLKADDNDPAVRTLTVIADSPQDAENGRAEILAVCTGTQGPLPTAVPPGEIETFCTIPNDKVGLVIGKGGMNIKQVMQDTGCQVQIPGVPDPGSNPPTRTLSVVGLPANIPRCIEEITKLVYRQAGTSGSYGVAPVQQSQVPAASPFAIPTQSYFQQQQPQIQHFGQPIQTQQYQAPQLQQPQVQPVYQYQSQQVAQSQPQQQAAAGDFKYTRSQWQQWKEYYRAQGKDLQEEAPENMRAANYFIS